jgi:hypothetical protein
MMTAGTTDMSAGTLSEPSRVIARRDRWIRRTQALPGHPNHFAANELGMFSLSVTCKAFGDDVRVLSTFAKKNAEAKGVWSP